MNYLFQILSGRPIMRNSVDEVLKKIRLQQLGRKQRMKAELELMKLKRPEYLPGIIPPDTLQDSLNLTKDTVSTLLQIKQKRAAMSQQDSKPFQWDDAKIIEFIRFTKNRDRDFTGYYSDLADFKASHSSSEKVGKDWEIQCLVVGDRNYWRGKNGLFTNQIFEEGVWAEDLMAHPDFKFIRSVKRLSDGEVFSIGDMCDTFFLGKIEHIRVNGKHCTVGGEKWGCPLQSAKKAPSPEEKPAAKPPIGIIPEWLWKEQRIKELKAVIKRYLDYDKKQLSLEWVYELLALEKWHDEWEQDIETKSKIQGGEEI